MKLHNHQILPYAFGLTRSLRTAHGEMSVRKGLLMRAQSDAGHTCFGEVAPFPGLSEETYGEAEQALRAVVERGALAIELDEHVDAVAASCDGLGLPPSVRHGVEQLWVDALSQKRGTSLAALLNPNAVGKVETARLVADAESALTAVAEGFETIKLKVGYQESAEDVRRVMAVREAVGADINIRIDANGAWTPGWAIDVLKRLASCRIECVEQPVAPEDIEGLAWVRSQSPISVAADESVRTAAQIMDVLEKRAADIVVLKPMLCGGPALTYSLGRLVQTRGVKVMVTTALDTAIGRASALHVAAALAGPQAVPAGLDTGGWLESDVAESPGVVAGRTIVPELAGLGISKVEVFE